MLASRINLVGDLVFLTGAEIARDDDNIMYCGSRLEFIGNITVIFVTTTIANSLPELLPSHGWRPLIHELLVWVEPALLLLLRLALVTLAALVGSGCCSAHLVGHLLDHVR